MIKKNQIVTPIRITKLGCLLVRSIEPKECYESGGYKEAYQYEWEINYYSFTKNPKDTQRKLGITTKEYSYWACKITYGQTKEKET